MPEPPIGDRTRFKLRVYLFATSQYLDIIVSRLHTVEEVIRHVISTCLGNRELRIKFFDPFGSGSTYRAILNQELYEMRLLDDDEDEGYLPLYDIAALSNGKCIGEFGADSLALCRKKGITFYHSSQSVDRLSDVFIQDGAIIKVYYNIGQKSGDLNVRIGISHNLKDLLNEIGKIRKQELKESLYIFEAYTPYSRQYNVFFTKVLHATGM